jgi:hypothetical protein
MVATSWRWNVKQRSRGLLLWSPRILSILVCLFLSLFALDAFGGGKTTSEALRDFAVHLAPMLALLAIVAVSWRWEWVGGLVFLGVAALYGYAARNHVSWVLVISLPMFLVGVLYLWSWCLRRHDLRAATLP